MNRDTIGPVAATKRRARPKAKDEYHHGDLRRALLAAAVAALEADGSADISLRALARRLGVSHGAPAHHFADKGALLDAIAADGYRELANVLIAAGEGRASAEAKLAASGVAYVKFAVAHPAHVRAMFGRPLTRAPSEECLYEANRAFDALVSLARSAAGPKANDAQLRTAIFGSWAMVHGLALLWLDGNGPLMASARDAAGLVQLAEEVTAMLSFGVTRLSATATKMKS